jgi:hypothetical protein
MPNASTRLADRALLRISGEGARDFLQGLLTQDVTAVGPGAPAWAGLLTPQGKALFDMILWDGSDADQQGGDTVLIDAEAARIDALTRRLAIYRLRRPIVIEPVAGLAVHWSTSAERGSPDPRHDALGHRWLAAEDGGDGGAEWRAHRLSLGVTEGLAELGDGETLWLECNARELRGVSFTKGCYIGQENTARMHHRSKVNRRLAVAPLAEPGDRTRVVYPELGLMVEHRRVEALGDALVPDWLAIALKD